MFNTPLVVISTFASPALGLSLGLAAICFVQSRIERTAQLTPHHVALHSILLHHRQQPTPPFKSSPTLPSPALRKTQTNADTLSSTRIFSVRVFPLSLPQRAVADCSLPPLPVVIDPRSRPRPFMPFPRLATATTTDVNHSCDPNVVFDVRTSGDWKVRALKDLPKGEVSLLRVSLLRLQSG
jgi:hypothetical protein